MSFSDCASVICHFLRQFRKTIRDGRMLKSIFTALCLLIVLAACQQPEPEPAPPGPLLKVGQRKLSMVQFERELQLSYPDLSNLSPAEQLPLKKQLVNRLIERELLLGEAERLNIQITPDELDAILLELRGAYSAEEYQQILREKGQTGQSWVAAIKLRRLTEKVIAAVIEPLARVSDEEIKEYYWANREHFHGPTEVRARQMLLASREDAELLLEQLKDGEDFAELAQEYSLSPDRETGGDLGYFSKGQLPPEFDEALFRLSPGQFSGPVQSPYGFHLFLVERRRRPGLRPLELVEAEIHQQLNQEREDAAFQQWLEALREKIPVSVDWAQLTPQTTAR